MFSGRMSTSQSVLSAMVASAGGSVVSTVHDGAMLLVSTPTDVSKNSAKVRANATHALACAALAERVCCSPRRCSRRWRPGCPLWPSRSCRPRWDPRAGVTWTRPRTCWLAQRPLLLLLLLPPPPPPRPLPPLQPPHPRLLRHAAAARRGLQPSPPPPLPLPLQPLLLLLLLPPPRRLRRQW